MGAPLARHLRTATAAERGIDTSPEGRAAVVAWLTASRQRHHDGKGGPWVLGPTYEEWSWVVNVAPPGAPLMRVWPAPAHWDAPGYWEGSPSTATALAGVKRPTDAQRAEAARGPFNVRDPQPWLVPWLPGFSMGKAPQGMAADNGCLVDLDADGARGWELLGLRAPNPGDRLGLEIRTRPTHPLGWLAVLLGLTRPNFRPGDMVADAVHFRTPENAGLVEGRGAGRIPKRRGIVTAAELDAGVIEHAVSVTAMNFNHGPIAPGQPPCEWIGPATRAEHGDRHNGTNVPAGAASTLPGRVVRNGQAYALIFTARDLEDWLDSRGYTGALRRTARIFAVALRDYGLENVETGGGDPQSECGLTPAQWAAHGVTSREVCVGLLDGLDRFADVVALQPSRAFLAAA